MFLNITVKATLENYFNSHEIYNIQRELTILLHSTLLDAAFLPQFARLHAA